MNRRTNSRISLPHNIASAHTLEDIKIQLGELVPRLEDYLNRQVNIHFLDRNIERPTLIAGDLVFDFTEHKDYATLQQWDGEKLIPLNVATIEGNIDLILRGIGSGNDRNMVLASNGVGGWELRLLEQIEFLATEDIPAFSLATAHGKIADSNNLLHFNKVIGMTIIDIANGAIGYATVDGEITNLSWAWSPGSKFFLNGTTISLTAPSSGFSQMVAIARNPNIIIMKLGEAILL